MKRGFSIIEIMVFVACILISVIGASGYRYLTTIEIRKSDQALIAGRTAEVLLQSWKGVGGVNSYNPLNDTGLTNFELDIGVSTSTNSPTYPTNFILLGYYKVNVDNDEFTYYVTMSYFDVIVGKMRVLNTGVQWLSNQGQTHQTAKTNKVMSMSTLVTYN